MAIGWHNIEESKGYWVLFGNSQWAIPFIAIENTPYSEEEKKQFKIWWKRLVKMSYSHRVGDIQLHYNGKIIRSIWNAREKCTDKYTKYKYTIHKYQHNYQHND